MRFKEFMIQEGDLLDAVKSGLKAGIETFKKTREDQIKKQESKAIAAKLLGAKGKELESLIKQMVDNTFKIKNEEKPQKTTDWLLECTNTKTKLRFAR